MCQKKHIAKKMKHTSSQEERDSCPECCDNPVRKNEAVAIAVFMAKEMSQNAKSTDTQKISNLLHFDYVHSFNQCMGADPGWFKELLMTKVCSDTALNQDMSGKAAAYFIWTENVMQGAKWDHKEILPTMFATYSSSEQHKHCYNNWLYYYDVWSNIHYGYVGAAAGLSDSFLLDGAGLEQIGSDIFRRKWPNSTADGLRGWDHPADRIAIELGINLYRQYLNNITGLQLLDALESIRDQLHVSDPTAYKEFTHANH